MPDTPSAFPSHRRARERLWLLRGSSNTETFTSVHYGPNYEQEMSLGNVNQGVQGRNSSVKLDLNQPPEDLK